MKAVQFSGGKDSTVMLYNMMDMWDDVTVYWASTGDAPPETVSFIESVAALVPRFVVVQSDVIGDKLLNGVPSDLVTNEMRIASLGGYSGAMKVRHSFDCCHANRMLPMYNRMVADGVTDVYRGQRNDDKHRGPIPHGTSIDGIVYHYPIRDLTDAEVHSVLAEYKAKGLPTPPNYDMLTSTPDCLHCTGWLSEDREEWLRTRHPEAYIYYTTTLDALRLALRESIPKEFQ